MSDWDKLMASPALPKWDISKPENLEPAILAWTAALPDAKVAEIGTALAKIQQEADQRKRMLAFGAFFARMLRMALPVPS